MDGSQNNEMDQSQGSLPAFYVFSDGDTRYAVSPQFATMHNEQDHADYRHLGLMSLSGSCLGTM
jgi:hypothetical protein